MKTDIYIDNNVIEKETAIPQLGGKKGSIIYIDGNIYKNAKKPEIDFYKWLYNYNQTNNDNTNIANGNLIETNEVSATDNSLNKVYKENNLQNINRNNHIDERCSNENKNKSFREKLKKFLPEFKGIKIINEEEYLSLENLYTGFDYPNALDIKIGKITNFDKISSKKIHHKMKRNNETTLASLGFRITGVLIKDENGKNQLVIDKKNSLDEINLENTLDFFAKAITRNGVLQKDLIKDIVIETKKILDFFKTQNELKFISSSLFYVFGKNNIFQVRYIDMGCYFWDGEYDKNSIEGIENIINFWERLYEY